MRVQVQIEWEDTPDCDTAGLAIWWRTEPEGLPIPEDLVLGILERAKLMIYEDSLALEPAEGNWDEDEEDGHALQE